MDAILGSRYPIDREVGRGGMATVYLARDAKHDRPVAVKMRPDPDTDYFADGLTEEVIADLSNVRALKVIARNSAMRLKGTDRDARTLGREVDVRYVLAGSVRRAGTQLRITAQLAEAAEDRQVWGGGSPGRSRMCSIGTRALGEDRILLDTSRSRNYVRATEPGKSGAGISTGAL